MKITHSSFLPKKISEWVMIISCLIYLIIDFTVDFQPFAEQVWTGSEPLKYWLLRRIRGISFAVFIASMIVLGIREVRYNGKTFKNLIMPVLGAIICISLALFGWYMETRWVEMHNILFEQTVFYDKIKKKLASPNLPLDKKLALSKSYAKIYYHRYGKQIEYLTQDETYVFYEPTKKDKEFYKEYLSGKAAVDWLIQSHHRAQYIWSMVLGISLLLGFMTPINKQKSKSIA